MPIYRLVLVVFAVAAFLVACSTVPDTGRSQFNLMNEAQLAEMGLSEFEKYKREKTVSRDSAYLARTERVGRHLAQVMPVPNAQWEFVVFEDPSPNAFALPGGKVGINTGIFQVTQNDAGLAAVIGHEVGHVVARHSGERVTRQMVTGIGAVVLGQVIGENADMSSAGTAATTAALGGAAALDGLRFSRSQELEADQLGALYMARAGYDPRESVAMWRRFAAYKSARGGSQLPEFLSTHPLDERRIQELQAFMPRAMQEYRPRG